MGLAASRQVGSSPIRNWTHVSRIGRRILYHWTTRETPITFFLSVFFSLPDFVELCLVREECVFKKRFKYNWLIILHFLSDIQHSDSIFYGKGTLLKLMWFDPFNAKIWGNKSRLNDLLKVTWWAVLVLLRMRAQISMLSPSPSGRRTELNGVWELGPWSLPRCSPSGVAKDCQRRLDDPQQGWDKWALFDKCRKPEQVVREHCMENGHRSKFCAFIQCTKMFSDIKLLMW